MIYRPTCVSLANVVMRHHGIPFGVDQKKCACLSLCHSTVWCCFPEISRQFTESGRI